MKRFLSAFVLTLFVAVLALGQGTTGKLSGTVQDSTGAAIAGATVTAKDAKTGKEQTVTANDAGEFSFPQLEFGTYTVTIVAPNFKKFVANEVKIDVGREYSLDGKLEAGNVQETVTVTAGADIVTATTAQVSSTVSPQQILSLPLITRNPLTLAGLQAGVSANSNQNTTINGMRTTFTNITRDGINIQDTFIRTNATDFAPGRPSVDDTGEFTIALANQEADQGYGGAQIRLVTPRGTKTFHGALFEYNRNSHFAANSFFRNLAGTPRPFRNRNQYGGKVSGPVWLPRFGDDGGPAVYKHKGFFFAYEGIKDPVSTLATRTILTPSARAGNFVFTRTNTTPFTNPFVSCNGTTVGSVCTVTNLLGFAQSVTGRADIPATIDPYILANIINPLPTTSNRLGGDSTSAQAFNTNGYQLNRGSDQTRNQWSTRGDVDINSTNTATIIYSWNREANLRPDADTTLYTTTPAVIQFSVNRQLTGAWRHVFGPSFVNEFRAGRFTSDVPFDRTDPVPAFFLTGLPVTQPVNTFLNQGRKTAGKNFQDNADWVLGKHTLRFGGQLQYFAVDAYNDAGVVPTLTVGTGTNTPTLTTANFSNLGGISTSQLGTANSLLALFGGFYTQTAQSFNIQDPATGFVRGYTQFQPWRYENHSLYVADHWSATKNLTLSLGLRYEIYPGLRLMNDLALEPVLDPSNPVQSLLDPNGNYNIIGTNSGRKHAYYKTDKNNFAPNLGVAWAPSFEKGISGFLFGQNKTVIRAGYSWVYGNDSIVTSINNAAVGNAGLARTTLAFTNQNGRVGSGFTEVPLPSTPTFPRSYLFNNQPGIGTFFGTVFGIDPKLETPKVQQYSFGIQREIGGNMAIEARYVGTRSNNLGRGIDLNQMDIVSNGFLADFLRAQANFALTGNAFCTTTGCQSLTIFQQNVAGSPGHLGVGTGGLSLTTFNNNLSNGTPADLAVSFINSSANFNHQPYNAQPTNVPFVKFLPNPATGVVDYFCNCGKYQYDSLQLELRRRFSNGLYFQANYTLSKNLTDAIGTSQNLFEPYFDNNRPELDYQRADYDQKHTFNFNGIYQLPFGKGKMFMNHGGVLDRIFGGWEVSGLWQWTSGAPITFVDARGTLNRAGRSARQTPNSNLTGDQIRALTGIFYGNGQPGGGSAGAVYFINPSILNSNGQASGGSSLTGATFPGQVFFNVAPGQTGNLGRTLIDGPGYFNVNAALLKNIRITESVRFQIRVEAFNLFNNVNFFPNTQTASITSAAFGQMGGTYDPRQIQFAGRFEF
jgi:hypothetical protein